MGAKGKGKHKKYTGEKCFRERELLVNLVEVAGLRPNVLPTGGTLCYSCIVKVNKWGKLSKEVSDLKDDLIKIIQANLNSHSHKRTLSETEREETLDVVEELHTEHENAPEVTGEEGLDVIEELHTGHESVPEFINNSPGMNVNLIGF